MNKTCILAFCLLLLAAGLRAQECTVGMLPGERWWGCVTDLGVRMPKGRWLDENGKVYKGGRTYALDVPLDRVPCFTRK